MVVVTGRRTASLALPFTLLYAATAVAVLAGVFFRFKGLGASPFAIDEYYIATSVKSILEHGLPRFHGGGFYDRGILLQYLAAPLFMAGISPEYAFRLITVLANLAAFPAIFLLARQVGGIVTACLALILFSLALWEVEFARFARMYAPFGALFLWHLYFVYRYGVLDDARALKWVLGLPVLGIVVSEFAVFMVVLALLPVVLRPARRPWLEYGVPAVLLAVNYFYITTNFRRLGVGEYLPPSEVTSGAAGFVAPIYLPPLMLPGIRESTTWLAAFVAVALLTVATVALWLRTAWSESSAPRARLLYLIPVGLLGLGLMHQFGLVVLCTLIVLFMVGPPRRELPRLLVKPLVLLTAAILGLSAVFWASFGVVTNPGPALLHNSTGHAGKDTVLLLMNYPSVYQEVLLQWLRALPVQTALMTGLIGLGLWFAANRETREDRAYLLLAALVVGFCTLVAVLEAPYSTTRYTHFLYGLVLILAAAAIARLAAAAAWAAWPRFALAASLVTAFMVVSEDFDGRHLVAIDSERVMYRMDYSAGRTELYYPRLDFRGAADHVNLNRGPDDIVIASEYGVPHYLDRLDYFYMDIDGGRFRGISGQAGTRDIWEGVPLLATARELFTAMAEARTDVWLIAKSDQVRSATAGELAAAEVLSEHRVFRSVDGNLHVYHVPAGDPVRALPPDPGHWPERSAP